MKTFNINIETERELPVDVAPMTDSAVPAADTAYHVGDLLVIAEGTNVATHSDVATGAQADWHVICAAELTAEQTNKKIADGEELPIFIGGKFDVKAVKLNGTALNKSQRMAARAHANRNLTVKLSIVEGA